LGGSNYDVGYDIAVDGTGSAYATGITYSVNFPTANPYDSTHNGGSYDAFVTKLSLDGSTLIYSTYLGGSGSDPVQGIAVERAGSAYLTGVTESADFPTVNAFDSSFNGGAAFVTKMSSDGNSLVYSTFLGSSSGGTGIAVDAAGSAYVTGFTSSSNFPTANPFDGSYNGGGGDAFVTKLSLAGIALDYSTFVGGGSYDGGAGIVVDGAGSAYVMGWTYSTDFPTTTPFDGSYNGMEDAFLTKLSPSDQDNDGIADALDNCIDVFNPDQTDTDADALGDACDTDDDNDGVIDGVDNCPFIANPIQQDGNGDGIGDVCCCLDPTGNVDCDPAGGVDISDLSALIDYLYITFVPLCCPKEANTDGQSGTDISDLSALIDYLYISFVPPAACQ
jgi:hypothetical protein